MGGDEVGDKVLFFACLARIQIKQSLELIVCRDTRFHHFRQGLIFAVLRRNFQISANMMSNQLFNILRVL